MNRTLLLALLASVASPSFAQTATGSHEPPRPPDRPTTDGTLPSPGDAPTSTRPPAPTDPAMAPGTTSAPRPSTGTRAVTPRDGMSMRDRFGRTDRDVRALGTAPDASRYRTEYDALRSEYDALGTGTDDATMQRRMDVERRYDDLDARVTSSRMTMAPRADFFRLSDQRMQRYDDDVAALRASYALAPAERRSDMARDLIRLRRQQDLYRDEVYGIRGAGASGFEAARTQSRAALDRYDADFRSARGEAMMRSTGMDGAMPSGAMPQGAAPRPGQ